MRVLKAWLIIFFFVIGIVDNGYTKPAQEWTEEEFHALDLVKTYYFKIWKVDNDVKEEYFESFIAGKMIYQTFEEDFYKYDMINKGYKMRNGIHKSIPKDDVMYKKALKAYVPIFRQDMTEKERLNLPKDILEHELRRLQHMMVMFYEEYNVSKEVIDRMEVESRKILDEALNTQ